MLASSSGREPGTGQVLSRLRSMSTTSTCSLSAPMRLSPAAELRRSARVDPAPASCGAGRAVRVETADRGSRRDQTERRPARDDAPAAGSIAPIRPAPFPARRAAGTGCRASSRRCCSCRRRFRVAGVGRTGRVDRRAFRASGGRRRSVLAGGDAVVGHDDRDVVAVGGEDRAHARASRRARAPEELEPTRGRAGRDLGDVDRAPEHAALVRHPRDAIGMHADHGGRRRGARRAGFRSRGPSVAPRRRPSSITTRPARVAPTGGRSSGSRRRAGRPDRAGNQRRRSGRRQPQKAALRPGRERTGRWRTPPARSVA